MSSETGASILDTVLTCIGERISIILHQPGDKDENYIASLHNEVLAATWIVGIQPSGSSSQVPESVRVAFRSFSDIRNPGSYTTPDGSQLPKGNVQQANTPQFNFTEWWEIGQGDTLSEPFDVRDEIVRELLCVLEMEASERLRARVIKGFKKVQELCAKIDSQATSIRIMLCSGIEKLETLAAAVKNAEE
ncbi:hypothetical protein EI94DRAFT_1803769 [Lactarius quietus]|nr:hypothetical protein EI94DRAFT_1803769 [Lactarius quietus]